MKDKFVATSIGQFAYELSGEGEASGILIHGGAANLRAWDGVVSILGRSNRCCTIDLPGHGKTSIEPVSFDLLTRAISELCQILEIDNPFVIGHSFGALVAAHLGQHYSNLMSGVMAVDPYLSNKEIRRKFNSVEEASSGVWDMQWPWRETDDVEEEVDRCLKAHYSPRADQENLRAMIRRGYRRQSNGKYLRYPRKQDEVRGIAANWSIDVGATFSSIACPLSVVSSTDAVWNHAKRRENLSEIAVGVTDFESIEMDCHHDIPGYLPDTLGNYILAWTARVRGVGAA
jgi:pimeloyl-ACP methyl ester carboxylesterase